VARHARPAVSPLVRKAALLLRSGCPAQVVEGMLREAVDAAGDDRRPAPGGTGAEATR
jgi:hypothetical protein